MPCAMNAANEVANLAFREDRCNFLDIEEVVRSVMNETKPDPVESLEQLHEVDARSREAASRALARISR